jgi:hypothetical protein
MFDAAVDISATPEDMRPVQVIICTDNDAQATGMLELSSLRAIGVNAVSIERHIAYTQDCGFPDYSL